MTDGPLLVLVTGEPGSGKSPLGRLVAAARRLPVPGRDDRGDGRR